LLGWATWGRRRSRGQPSTRCASYGTLGEAGWNTRRSRLSRLALSLGRYAEVGGGLPPHADLTRTGPDGRTSLCTFILYLSDCEVGGETVLLEALPQPSAVRAAVTPRRGRLLLFPHLCPHLARPVVAEGLPKLLLRGEML